jgi:hypothetical protein
MQSYQTLVRQPEDYPVLVTFHRRVSGTLAALILLTAYPLNAPVLGTLMGLDETMRHYIALPLAFCALFPVMHGGANLLRGIFTKRHQTGTIGRVMVYKVIYMLICWAIVLMTTPPVPGVAVAVFLIVSAELLELVYMRRRLAA